MSPRKAKAPQLEQAPTIQRPPEAPIKPESGGFSEKKIERRVEIRLGDGTLRVDF